MMLRSASTPVLGSLLSSSFSESTPHKHPTPNNIHHNSTNLSCNKSLSHSNSPQVSETQKGIRRVQSEGNLENLVNIDEFAFPANKLRRKPTLEAIPSFSSHNLEDYDCEEEEEEDDEELQYSNRFTVQNLICEEVTRNVNDYRRFQIEGKMYLAAGIGVPAIGYLEDGGNGGCGGGGGSFGPFDYNRDGGDSRGKSMEEYYKNMLEENPGNPLFLRNYAHFLYDKKGDLKGAEEYYSRAILADPNDGEVLCQYAKLTWELHGDKERAAAYFQRAVQASSEDSQIQASYASFLWDAEDDEGDGLENGAADNSHVGAPLFRPGVMASATAY